MGTFGRVDQLEVLEIAAIAKHCIRIAWLAGSLFDPLVDRIATPGTKLA